MGETLTADTTGIADEDGLTTATFSYQWIAGGSDIDGATRSTYTLTTSQQGQDIQVRVSFTDDRNNAETLTSEATGAVAAAANRAATGLPTIGGTVQVDQTLTAVTKGITDADGLTNVSYSYQWIRTDGGTDTDIAGEMNSTYTLVSADVGKAIKVKVSFTDDGGHDEILTSAATGAVAAAEPAGPPLAPQNLTAVVNGDGHIVLSWEAPDDDSITGYQILRRRPTEGEDTLLVYVADTQSTAATFTDTDVTEGVQHAYRVKAINAAGAGPVSNFVNVTP